MQSMQQVNETSPITSYYFSPPICSIVFDYLFLMANYSSSKLSGSNGGTSPLAAKMATTNKMTKRRSIFFPLLVDESLDKCVMDSLVISDSQKLAPDKEPCSSDLFKQLFELITQQVDDRAILVTRYLASSLGKCANYLPGSLMAHRQNASSQTSRPTGLAQASTNASK
jgi:hypothetical protein